MCSEQERSDDLVSESESCPECGERRMDWLVWNTDEHVECMMCGHVYNPTGGPVLSMLVRKLDWFDGKAVQR